MANITASIAQTLAPHLVPQHLLGVEWPFFQSVLSSVFLSVMAARRQTPAVLKT